MYSIYQDNNLCSISTVSTSLLADQSLPKVFSNDPVFYGPDGNVLTEEESAFLWNATSGPNDNYFEDDEYVVEYLFFCLLNVKFDITLC